MSWGTSIKLKHKSVYIQSINLDSFYDLDNQLTECNKDIEDCFKRLENLAFATPKDIAPGKMKKGEEYGYESPYEFIQYKIRDIREELDELLYTRHKLLMAKYLLDDYEYGDSSDKEKINLKNPEDWKKIVENG